jgi:hypothetical protein
MTDVDDVRSSYLVAAGSAVALARSPEVAAKWREESALPEWSVAGLTAHLLSQITAVAVTLNEPVGNTELLSLLEHYDRVPWRQSTMDDAPNVAIRASSEEKGTQDHSVLLDNAAGTLEVLRPTVLRTPLDQLVKPPWTRWALHLEDFLVTRLMEIAVHSDDVAFSVGLDTPEVPETVMARVRHLLIDLAAQSHGNPAVVRALTRRERAPSFISAF